MPHPILASEGAPFAQRVRDGDVQPLTIIGMD